MYKKIKKAAVQTGLEFFSPAVLPFLHFLSAWGEKSHSYEAQWSNLALKHSDNEHSVSAGQRSHFEKAERAHGLSTYSLSRGMMVRDTQHPRISLPAAQWVASPGLVLLCHSLPTAAKNGPLGQRMPSSSSLRSHVFSPRTASRLWDTILERQLELPACFISEGDGSIGLPSSPALWEEKTSCEKYVSSLDFSLPLGVTQRSRLSLPSLTSSPLRSCCSLWPPVPVFHPAVYYFDQYPPIPLLSLPLSLPPKLT